MTALINRSGIKADAGSFPLFVSETAAPKSEEVRRQLESELRDLVEQTSDSLLRLIALDNVALAKVKALQEYLDNDERAEPLSEEEEQKLIEALDTLMAGVREAFQQVWSIDDAAVTEHLSDLLNVGWKTSTELFEAAEEARWTVMNSVEGLTQDSTTFNDVEKLLASLSE